MLTLDEVREHSNDREFIEKAIEEDGLLLDGASDELKDDKDLVMKAVTKDGGALEFASIRLKNNPVRTEPGHWKTESNLPKKSPIIHILPTR